MLYIAISLVLAGIALILYSLTAGKREESVSASFYRRSDAFSGEVPREETLRRVPPVLTGEEEVPLSPPHPPKRETRESTPSQAPTRPMKRPELANAGDYLAAGESRPADDLIVEEKTEEQFSQKNADNDLRQDKPVLQQEKSADAENNSAVLYDDPDQIIETDGGEAVINPTPEYYQKLKRVGRGKLEISREGINFRMEKKLYRFDYHRIDDISWGGSHLVLLIKGSPVTRLFLFDRESRFIEDIYQSFRKYKKGRMPFSEV